ncbi:hypothetical protein M758_11G038200 [Ceratodon purpureus]|uniref:Uncharacterized protein n=1 Tax=Ceratodon purpureus TaxID=3225 RepID=A0A8T0GAT2_CERPU|nr:hypothetical protein KC19_11G039100 [Ceratodon purpureus]KAG0600487.1 hypothetical protein M758_11G038200 [Ceratodon purpureus]KAG0600488.1 hypothetical protein M758_11G038200 [Ceratodon purpureus]
MGSTEKFDFVEVIGPDGKKKRFANGTRAGFAVERFNKLIPNDSKPVVCIQAYKEGEEPIEFGPDVELILYDTAWVLQSVSEYVFPIPDNYVEAEIETIQTQTVEKELYKWSDSSQAPWEINEDVAKTLLDKTAPTDGEILPGARGWEEFYPGGVLPEGGKQDCTPEYVAKVLLMFLCIFGFAGALGYFLERMPEMLPKYNTIEPS